MTGVAYYNEIDPYAAQWLRNLIAAGHIAPGDVDERSILEVRPDDLRNYTQCHFFAGIGGWSLALRIAGWPDDRPVWTGSCPCQPFSAAGKQRGSEDERHLWPAFFSLIRERGPSRVFGEQVAGAAGLAWLDHVCADLEGAGYAAAAADLCAAGAGAPHIRQRLYWVAHATDQRRQRGWSGEAGDGRDQARLEPERLCDALGVADSDLQCQRPANDAAGPGNFGGTCETVGLGHASREGLAQRVGQPGVPGCEDGAGPGEATERAGIHPGGLADTKQHGDRGEVEATDHRQPQTDGPADRTGGCGGTSGGLGHADGQHAGRDARAGAGAQAGCGLREVGDLPSPPSATSRPGPTNGFWRDADWLACRDGKWRPVEPGTFPLAHGATSRVGRLRAYGNAIVPQVAAAFIRSMTDPA